MALQPFFGSWPLFQFFNVYTVGWILWTGDQPVTRPLPTHRTTQTQNKRTQTSMPLVGFEPTKPVSERAKTVHDLDRAATVIGNYFYSVIYFGSSRPYSDFSLVKGTFFKTSVYLSTIVLYSHKLYGRIKLLIFKYYQ
jgi:hypothetical protein